MDNMQLLKSTYQLHRNNDSKMYVLAAMAYMAPQEALGLAQKNPQIIDELIKPRRCALSALINILIAARTFGDCEMRFILATRLCISNTWHCIRLLLLGKPTASMIRIVCRLMCEISKLGHVRPRCEFASSGAVNDLCNAYSRTNPRLISAICEAVMAIIQFNNCNCNREQLLPDQILNSIVSLTLMEMRKSCIYPRATLTVITLVHTQSNSRYRIIQLISPYLASLSELRSPASQGMLIMTWFVSGLLVAKCNSFPKWAKFIPRGDILGQLSWFLLHNVDVISTLAAKCLALETYQRGVSSNAGVEGGCVPILWLAAHDYNVIATLTRWQKEAAYSALCDLQQFTAGDKALSFLHPTLVICSAFIKNCLLSLQERKHNPHF